jgi:hypothetical protein
MIGPTVRRPQRDVTRLVDNPQFVASESFQEFWSNQYLVEDVPEVTNVLGAFVIISAWGPIRPVA